MNFLSNRNFYKKKIILLHRNIFKFLQIFLQIFTTQLLIEAYIFFWSTIKYKKLLKNDF